MVPKVDGIWWPWSDLCCFTNITMHECQFGLLLIHFLGLTLSEGVVLLSPKVQAVADCPHPISLKAMQEFLGMENFTIVSSLMLPTSCSLFIRTPRKAKNHLPWSTRCSWHTLHPRQLLLWQPTRQTWPCGQCSSIMWLVHGSLSHLFYLQTMWLYTVSSSCLRAALSLPASTIIPGSLLCPRWAMLCWRAMLGSPAALPCSHLRDHGGDLAGGSERQCC